MQPCVTLLVALTVLCCDDSSACEEGACGKSTNTVVEQVHADVSGVRPRPMGVCTLSWGVVTRGGCTRKVVVVVTPPDPEL